MAPDKLKINVDQRQVLVDTSNRDGVVKAGDTVEPFELINVGRDWRSPQVRFSERQRYGQ
jgi:hypothetical protein